MGAGQEFRLELVRFLLATIPPAAVVAAAKVIERFVGETKDPERRFELIKLTFSSVVSHSGSHSTDSFMVALKPLVQDLERYLAPTEEVEL